MLDGQFIPRMRVCIKALSLNPVCTDACQHLFLWIRLIAYLQDIIEHAPVCVNTECTAHNLPAQILGQSAVSANPMQHMQFKPPDLQQQDIEKLL